MIYVKPPFILGINEYIKNKFKGETSWETIYLCDQNDINTLWDNFIKIIKQNTNKNISHLNK